jgi:hypothetical protein
VKSKYIALEVLNKNSKEFIMSNATMQAIQAHDYGGPEVLVLEQAPRPEPGADQVLI